MSRDAPIARPRSRAGSLRRKFMWVVMAATAAALLLSAAALLAYEIRSYRNDRASDLRSQAGLIALSLAPTLAFDDARAAYAALEALRLRPQIQAAAAFTADGRLFASYQKARVDGPSQAAALPAAPGADGERAVDGGLELFEPIVQDGERLGTVYLRAHHDLRSRVLDYLGILAGASLAGLALAALIFRGLHPAITRPIYAVADVARRVMDEHDYELRAPKAGDDEVGVLVDAFNNMLRDLSAEMKVRQAAEEALRAADRRKDEFLATLAHELRNPLAPLANGLAILQRADGNPQVRQSTHALMARQLAQMVRLIDDLIDVSRITRGTPDLQREVLDVVDVARRAVESAQPMIAKHGHRLDTRLPAHPVWARIDPVRMTQVFVNLLHNAAKYTPSHGVVTFSLQQAQDQLVVAVRDDGIGIDPSQQHAIFDMFVQVNQSLERGNSGLGLGLTIAKQLVELHGGMLGVCSAGLGRGSTFTVTLPTVPAPPASALPLADDGMPRSPSNGTRVLIADDNRDFADTLASLLRLQGHEVCVAYDGLGAWHAAVQPDGAPTIAFLDIGMPGLNGYELARRLRAQAATRDTVLVAVTGWGQETDRQQAREAGFDHHLVKPIDLQEASRLIGQVRQA